MNEVPICQLSVGQHFGLRLETTGQVLPGTILYISSGSVYVEWDAAPRTVQVGDREFQANPRKREHISLETPVFPLAVKLVGQRSCATECATIWRYSCRKFGRWKQAGFSQ